MPELPEVEVVRRGLENHLKGREIEAVTVLHPRPVRSHPAGPEGFVSDLAGRGVDAVARRGKYLWLVLGDDAMIAHLGMSGQFRVNRPQDPQLRNTRVLFDLDDGTQSAGLVRLRCSSPCSAASASRPCPGSSAGRQTLRRPVRAGRTGAG